MPTPARVLEEAELARSLAAPRGVARARTCVRDGQRLDRTGRFGCQFVARDVSSSAAGGGCV
jgi:hypothetical protein